VASKQSNKSGKTSTSRSGSRTSSGKTKTGATKSTASKASPRKTTARKTTARKPTARKTSTPRKRATKKQAELPLEKKGGEFLPPESRRSLAYMAAMGVCALTTLSLLSYSPDDPSWSTSGGGGEIANWCGRLGAVTADALYQLSGWSAWAILPFGIWLGLRFTRRPAGNMARLIIGLFGVWWASTLFNLLFYTTATDSFPAGGLIGQVMAGLLLGYLGTAGSYVVCGLALLAVATVTLGIDWEAIAGRGIDAAATATPAAGQAIARGGRRALTVSAGAVAETWRKVRARPLYLRMDDDEEYYTDHGEDFEDFEDYGYTGAGFDGLEDEISEPVDDEDSLRSGTSSSRSPMAIPIDRDPELGLGSAGSEITRHTFNLDAPLPEGNGVPTVVAARQLVEVEYVPTGHVPSAGLFSQAAPPPSPVAPKVRSKGIAPLPTGFDPRDAPEPSGLTPVPAKEPQLKLPVFEEMEEAEELPADPMELDAPIRPGFLESGGDELPDGADQRPRRRFRKRVFQKPTVALLDVHEREIASLDEVELKQLAVVLEQKLADFKIRGEVTAIQPGPVITTFEFLPAAGVKLSRIASLTDDIAMAMRAIRVRIVAPIPGRGVVGIEIPNRVRQMVWYRDMMVSKAYREGDWILPMILGKTVEGRPYVADLAKMPHLLVGGTTGSGKSVGVNSMLLTLLYHCTPEDMRMILIDPKMLEFELYGDIPHLLHPVVTEPKLAAAALKWACTEMDNRYRVLARWGTRNIKSYNDKLARELKDWTPAKAKRYGPKNLPEGEEAPLPKKFPYIVIVIDELADLMMIAAKDVEESIVRLAQKARACGIHLIVATQRPSVDVITGLIKANMPSRIAFQVRSKIDGRTILDQNGAETLLGKGDMLLLPPGVSSLVRIHGPFVSDEEAQAVSDHLREQGAPDYSADIRVEDESAGGALDEDEYDDFYDDAVQIVTDAGKASTSMIQRRLKIGYNRAARIIEMMERDGVVGPADGSRPREVLAGRQ